MKTIIKQIFGERKEMEKVSEDDIRNLIEKWKIEESAILEYKSTESLKVYKNGNLINEAEPEKCRQDKKEDLLIKPLVAFLNKHQPDGGLLIWGIKDNKYGIPIGLRAFQTGTIKKDFIERWIFMNISSVPFVKDFPNIEIEEIEIDGKSVFLIEIHPRDFNTVYFSKITNKVYIRRGKNSPEIPLPDIYRLIKEKIIAKVFVIPEPKIQPLDSEKVKAEIKFFYLNKGYKPAEWVKSLLTIKVEGEKRNLKFNATTSFVFKPPNKLHFVWNSEITCPIEGITFQIDRYFKEVIYPHKPHEICTLIIEYTNNTHLKIEIQTYEYEGMSKQQIHLLPNGKLEEEFSIFAPYVA
jgi:hypothetical protein